MFFSESVRKIFAYSTPVDMRKSFDGLLALVKSVLAEDPLSGSLYVFVNRQGNYLKLIYWDRTGYCLFAKRLERGKFKFSSCNEKQELSEQKLKLILDGIRLGRNDKMS